MVCQHRMKSRDRDRVSTGQLGIVSFSVKLNHVCYIETIILNPQNNFPFRLMLKYRRG